MDTGCQSWLTFALESLFAEAPENTSKQWVSRQFTAGSSNRLGRLVARGAGPGSWLLEPYQMKSLQWLQNVGCLKNRATNLWSLISWTFFCLRAPLRWTPAGAPPFRPVPVAFVASPSAIFVYPPLRRSLLWWQNRPLGALWRGYLA